MNIFGDGAAPVKLHPLKRDTSQALREGDAPLCANYIASDAQAQAAALGRLRTGGGETDQPSPPGRAFIESALLIHVPFTSLDNTILNKQETLLAHITSS